MHITIATHQQTGPFAAEWRWCDVTPAGLRHNGGGRERCMDHQRSLGLGHHPAWASVGDVRTSGSRSVVVLKVAIRRAGDGELVRAAGAAQLPGAEARGARRAAQVQWGGAAVGDVPAVPAGGTPSAVLSSAPDIHNRTGPLTRQAAAFSVTLCTTGLNCYGTTTVLMPGYKACC
jgi:hypothetical protein